MDFRRMEGSIKNHDRERMKMVMLKQEETFRYQVHELHRLYRTQMLLTRDSKNAKMEMQRKRINLESWNEENETTNLEFTAEDCKGENNCEGMIEADEESRLELTLATGSSRTIQWKKDDATFTSDSGSSFSSSSNESGTMKQYRNEWASSEGLEKSTSFRNINNGLNKVERKMRQDALDQPSWLFQCNEHDMVASFGL